MPWNGSPMSGAVSFEAAGNEYRVQKNFKKTASSDKTTVYNITSGDSHVLPSSDEVGEVFFKMEQGEFERSVFIGQAGAFSSDASADSLAMRIANLSVSGDESISQKAVTSRLAAAKEELISKSGKKGALVEAQARLDALTDEKHILESSIREQRSLTKEISRLENDIARSEKLLKRISAAKAAENAKRELTAYRLLKAKTEQRSAAEGRLTDRALSVSQVSEILSECRRLKEKISELTESIHGSGAVSASDKEILRLKAAENTVSDIRRDIELLGTAARDAEERIEKAQNDAERRLRKKGLLWLFLGAVLAIISSALGVAVNRFFFVLLAVFPLCLAMCVQSMKRAKKSRSPVNPMNEIPDTVWRSLRFGDTVKCTESPDSALEALKKLQHEAENSISEILFSCKCKSIDELEALAAEQHERQAHEARELDTLKESFTALMTDTADINSFSAALSEYTVLSRRMKELDELNRDIATVAAASGIADLTAAALDDEIRRLEEIISQSSSEENLPNDSAAVENSLLQMRADLADCLGRLKPPEKDREMLKNEISECRGKVSELRERYDTLCIADEVMQEAISETNRGLGSYLSRRTGEYLSHMSGGRYRDVIVSRDMNVEARSGDETGYHEWKYLSCGAIDRIYLALRLAAADVITKEHEPLPIFLDDVLAQYDDKSCADTLKFLNDYLTLGETSKQLLFFTCHRHIADMARDIIDDLNVISL